MSVDIENPSYGPYCIPKDTPLDRQLQIPRAKVLRGFCKVQDYAGLCSMHAGLNNVNPGPEDLSHWGPKMLHHNICTPQY